MLIPHRLFRSYLRRKFTGIPAGLLRSLEYGTQVMSVGTVEVSVTFVEANHCIGSAMVWVRSSVESRLHTGTPAHHCYGHWCMKLAVYNDADRWFPVWLESKEIPGWGSRIGWKKHYGWFRRGEASVRGHDVLARCTACPTISVSQRTHLFRHRSIQSANP